MIRFCDRNVYCITEKEFDREQLDMFFSNNPGHENVYIVDETGKYIGSISCGLVREKENFKDIIKRDYVIFNEDIWENGRKYFKDQMHDFKQMEMLPVLNEEHKLIAFAWQDDEANRELRMLEELMECDDAVGFQDVYPEYDIVIISGFNELVWCFAQYLKKLNIPFKLEDVMWKELLCQEDLNQYNLHETLDYRRYMVNGEGTGPWNERVELRNSVSAEFECIDRIYEENIRRKIIRNCPMSFENMISKLQRRQIGILGTGYDALNAYDALLGHGVDICCFISETEEKTERTIFGKRVLNRIEAVRRFSEIVFVEAESRNSIWGVGGTDFYHYIGYKRNDRFFILRDYMEIFNNGLCNILVYVLKDSNKRLILLGDVWLCLNLYQAIKEGEGVGEIVYCDILRSYSAYTDNIEMPVIPENRICKKDICLVVIPEYYGRYLIKALGYTYREGKILRKYREAAQRIGVTDLVDYPVENRMLMAQKRREKGKKDVRLKVGHILIGAINYQSGNSLFRGILDSHPRILTLPDDYLSSNLFSICTRLEMVNKSDVLSLFWKIYDEEGQEYAYIMGYEVHISHSEREKFNRYMRENLEKKTSFTAQDFFVMIHISWAQMQGKKLDHISDIVIYWEPHRVFRDKCEEYAIWLNGVSASGFIVNIVRNNYIRAGSVLRFASAAYENGFSNIGLGMLGFVLGYPEKDKQEYDGWKRLVLKFEDLKCNMKEEIGRLADELDFEWSDTLLDITENGKKSSYFGVSGFDLKPVYRTYEEYFSDFDRFRITLIAGPWQKKYGYPYVSTLNFSRNMLCEMYMQNFRYEDSLHFKNEEERVRYEIYKKQFIAKALWEIRVRELMDMESS